MRRRDLKFTLVDLVYFKIYPMKEVKRFENNGKLNPQYVGPCRILSHFGKEYEPELPADLASLHLVFHISLFKKYIFDLAIIVPLESVDVQDRLFY